LTQNAQFTGAESFLVEASDDLQGWGIENGEAYKRNREAFKKVILHKDASEAFLNSFYIELEKAAASYLNKELKDFLRTQKSCERETVSLAEWLRYLKKQSISRLDLDFEQILNQKKWPILVRYFRLEKIGKGIEQEKVKKETEAFLRDIKHFKVDPKLVDDIANDSTHTRFLFERLLDQLPDDFSFSPYRHLRLYLQQQILTEELLGEKLYEETDRLTNQLLETLAKTKEEKAILDRFKDYQLLKKLLNLELSREEYEKFFQGTVLKGTVPFRTVPHQEALQFYQGAIEREKWMIQNAVQRMRDLKQNQPVLITGGFHAQGLKQMILDSGFSYVQITPRIHEISKGAQKLYLQAMIGQSLVRHSKIEPPLRSDVNQFKAFEPAFVEQVRRSIFQSAAQVITAERPGKREKLLSVLRSSEWARSFQNLAARSEVRSGEPESTNDEWERKIEKIVSPLRDFSSVLLNAKEPLEDRQDAARLIRDAAEGASFIFSGEGNPEDEGLVITAYEKLALQLTGIYWELTPIMDDEVEILRKEGVIAVTQIEEALETGLSAFLAALKSRDSNIRAKSLLVLGMIAGTIEKQIPRLTDHRWSLIKIMRMSQIASEQLNLEFFRVGSDQLSPVIGKLLKRFSEINRLALIHASIPVVEVKSTLIERIEGEEGNYRLMRDESTLRLILEEILRLEGRNIAEPVNYASEFLSVKVNDRSVPLDADYILKGGTRISVSLVQARADVRGKVKNIVDHLVLGGSFIAAYGLGIYFEALQFSIVGFVPFLVWYVVKRLKDQTRLGDSEQALKESEKRSRELERNLKESERKFKEFFESIPIPFHRLNDQGKIVEVNDKWLETLGYTREEVIGESILNFIDPDQREEASARLQERLKGGEAATPKKGDRRYVKKDGTKVSVLSADAVQRDETGKITGILRFFIDITKLREAEEKLRNSEELYRTLMEKFPGFVILKDTESKFVWANKRALDLMGQPLEKVIGGTDFNFFSAEEAERFRGVDRIVVTEKRAVHFEEDNGGKIMGGTKAPIFDEKGDAKFILVVFEDITARKQLEKESLRVERLVAMEELILRVAHEIANPAANMSLLLYDIVDRLNQGEIIPVEELKEQFSDLDREVRRISDITARTLGLLKRQNNDKFAVFIENVVREVLRDARSLLNDAGIHVILDLGEDPTAVIANRDGLKGAFLDMITNAKNAMKDSPRKNLTIKVARIQNEEGRPAVQISFQDTGRGIPPAQIDKIWESRWTDQPDKKGTGMGLANVMEVAREHQGRVGVTSQVKVGTTFTLELPLVTQETDFLEQKAQSVQKFIYRKLWHDANNLLGVVIGYADPDPTLQNPLPPPITELFSELQKQGEAVGEILRRVQKPETTVLENRKALHEIILLGEKMDQTLRLFPPQWQGEQGAIHYQEIHESLERLRRTLQLTASINIADSFREKAKSVKVIETLTGMINLFKHLKGIFEGGGSPTGELDAPILLKDKDTIIWIDKASFLLALYHILVFVKNLDVRVDLNDREGEVILSFHSNHFQFTDDQLKISDLGRGENAPAILKWERDKSNDLAVSHRILTRYGGRLAIQNRGEGSDIRVFIPFVRKESETGLRRRQVEELVRGEEFDPRPKQIKPGAPKVLVADDEEKQRDLLQQILKNYNVWIARNGQEGYDLIREAQKSGEPFDLAILDISMNLPDEMESPIQDGRILTRKLREEGYTLPIIISTGHAVHDEELHKAFGKLINGMMPKISSVKEKLALIQQVLEMSSRVSVHGQPERSEIRNQQGEKRSRLTKFRSEVRAHKKETQPTGSVKFFPIKIGEEEIGRVEHFIQEKITRVQIRIRGIIIGQPADAPFSLVSSLNQLHLGFGVGVEDSAHSLGPKTKISYSLSPVESSSFEWTDGAALAAFLGKAFTGYLNRVNAALDSLQKTKSRIYLEDPLKEKENQIIKWMDWLKKSESSLPPSAEDIQHLQKAETFIHANTPRSEVRYDETKLAASLDTVLHEVFRHYRTHRKARHMSVSTFPKTYALEIEDSGDVRIIDTENASAPLVSLPFKNPHIYFTHVMRAQAIHIKSIDIQFEEDMSINHQPNLEERLKNFLVNYFAAWAYPTDFTKISPSVIAHSHTEENDGKVYLSPRQKPTRHKVTLPRAEMRNEKITILGAVQKDLTALRSLKQPDKSQGIFSDKELDIAFQALNKAWEAVQREDEGEYLLQTALLKNFLSGYARQGVDLKAISLITDYQSGRELRKGPRSELRAKAAPSRETFGFSRLEGLSQLEDESSRLIAVIVKLKVELNSKKNRSLNPSRTIDFKNDLDHFRRLFEQLLFQVSSISGTFNEIDENFRMSPSPNPEEIKPQLDRMRRQIRELDESFQSLGQHLKEVQQFYYQSIHSDFENSKDFLELAKQAESLRDDIKIILAVKEKRPYGVMLVQWTKQVVRFIWSLIRSWWRGEVSHWAVSYRKISKQERRKRVELTLRHIQEMLLGYQDQGIFQIDDYDQPNFVVDSVKRDFIRAILWIPFPLRRALRGEFLRPIYDLDFSFLLVQTPKRPAMLQRAEVRSEGEDESKQRSELQNDKEKKKKSEEDTTSIIEVPFEADFNDLIRTAYSLGTDKGFSFQELQEFLRRFFDWKNDLVKRYYDKPWFENIFTPQRENALALAWHNIVAKQLMPRLQKGEIKFSTALYHSLNPGDLILPGYIFDYSNTERFAKGQDIILYIFNNLDKPSRGVNLTMGLISSYIQVPYERFQNHYVVLVPASRSEIRQPRGAIEHILDKLVIYKKIFNRTSRARIREKMVKKVARLWALRHRQASFSSTHEAEDGAFLSALSDAFAVAVLKELNRAKYVNRNRPISLAEDFKVHLIDLPEKYHPDRTKIPLDLLLARQLSAETIEEGLKGSPVTVQIPELWVYGIENYHSSIYKILPTVLKWKNYESGTDYEIDVQTVPGAIPSQTSWSPASRSAGSRVTITFKGLHRAGQGGALKQPEFQRSELRLMAKNQMLSSASRKGIQGVVLKITDGIIPLAVTLYGTEKEIDSFIEEFLEAVPAARLLSSVQNLRAEKFQSAGQILALQGDVIMLGPELIKQGGLAFAGTVFGEKPVVAIAPTKDIVEFVEDYNRRAVRLKKIRHARNVWEAIQLLREVGPKSNSRMQAYISSAESLDVAEALEKQLGDPNITRITPKMFEQTIARAELRDLVTDLRVRYQRLAQSA